MQDNEKVKAAKRNAKLALIICSLIAIPASIYFIFFGFKDGDNISGHGYAAHVIGVILAFLSAFIFMGITFFSSRSGHDEQPNYLELVKKQKEKESLNSRPKD